MRIRSGTDPQEALAVVAAALHDAAVATALLKRLDHDVCSIAQLQDWLVASGFVTGARALVMALAAARMIEFIADRHAPICVIEPLGSGFTLLAEPPLPPWSVSRFAFLLPVDGGATLRTCHGTAVGWISARGVQLLSSRSALSGQGLSPADESCLALLAATGFLVPGEEPATEHPSWEFHDLLMHTQSRAGRGAGRIGGTYRFAGLAPAEPPMKPVPAGLASIDLPEAAALVTAARELSFGALMSRRASVDEQGAAPLDIGQLSAFLTLTFRVTINLSLLGIMSMTRSYPNGGNLHEHEIYLAIHSCPGVERGLHHYDRVGHRLVLMARAGPSFEAFLASTASNYRSEQLPQVLVCIASRFRRVAWKYERLSYALQLKNAGVILQHLYNAATALGLGGRALGNGNSEQFHALSGTDFYVEGPVAEFLLGSLSARADG
jgi:SagB-type dehydrogenase family enzyme